MALWFSDGSSALPMQPLGNGRLLVWEEGASFYSFRTSYCAPHLCSLIPDFGGAYHEIDTSCWDGGEGMVHRLYYSSPVLEASTRSLCDLQITDILHRNSDQLIRRFDGLTSLAWRLNIPSYVHTVFHSAYRFGKMHADTLFLTIPAGTPFENGLATLREQTAALVFCGTLRYDPLDSVLYYCGDVGELYILCHDDPKEMIRAGERLLQNFHRYGDLPTLHPIYGATVKRMALSEPLTEKESITRALLSMQSASGAVAASHREPYAVAADLPALTAALMEMGQDAAAVRMLLCWTAAAQKCDFVPPKLLCDVTAAGEFGQSDPSAASAYLLAAVRCSREASMTAREKEDLFRGMRAAFSALMQGFREGMLPFGGNTAAFDAGILGRELLFQGSAEVTALGIFAGQEFLAYCEQNCRRAAKDDKGYRRILHEAIADYEKNFVFKGNLFRNSPRLEGITRRPRFIRGICTLCQKEGAYAAEGMLELDKYGRYLCRRCFANHRGAPEETDPARRYHSSRATALAALLLSSPAALAELPRLGFGYARRLADPQAVLPLRESDTDLLLLFAFRYRRTELCEVLQKDPTELAALWRLAGTCGLAYAETEEPREEVLLDYLTNAVSKIVRQEKEDDALSALLCDTAGLGARCASGATALYYLTLQ